MVRFLTCLIAAVFVIAACGNLPTESAAPASDQEVVAAKAGGGFDEFGYNYTARIFVGPADGYDRVLGNDPI